MKKTIKQMLSLILVIAMVCGMIPSAFAGNVKKAAPSESKEVTQADYAAADAVWEQITESENKLLATKASQKKMTASAMNIVKASDNYVEGSLQQNGESFTWKTEEGISCHYSPRLRQQMREAKLNPQYDPNEEVPVESVSYATKGGSPSAKNVYLIEPYYGIDTSFTTQYQTEAKSIASNLGGTYTCYKTTNATITNIAKAFESGAVVIFDSHGSTDYENGEDYTSGATTSYLCLQSGTGITTADYTNNHALYAGSNGSMKYYEVDGTAIANHITTTCPNNILWMAICLGMATDGLQKPLRAKGVEVVYGYSQSVSFMGDYCFEGSFWSSMKNGKSVKEAISTMKSTYGYWDYSPAILSANGYSSSSGYSTITTARNNYAAFPIVVSSEDAYPGHGKVDALQTVKSTYTLKSTATTAPKVTAVSNNTAYGTVSVIGNTITAKPASGYHVASAKVTSGTGTCTVSGNTITVKPTTDCTVTVTFAKTASTVIVTFSVPDGVTQSAKSGTAGSTITLPTPSGKPSDTSKSYTFAGWATSKVSDTTTAPSLLKAGSSYTLSTNKTLYAVYSYKTTTTSGSTGSGTYTLVTSASQLTSGAKVVIAANDYNFAMGSKQNTNNRPQAAVTKSGNTLSFTSGVGEFTLGAGTTSGTYSFYDSVKGGYLSAASSSANYLRTQASLSANSSWKVTVSSTGSATVVAQGTYKRNSMRFNKTSKLFSCYASGLYPVALYVKSSGSTGSSTTTTTHYTSEIVGTGSGSGSGSGSTGGTTTGTGSKYTLVTSASGVTNGEYVLVVKAGGKNKGTSTYYALTAASDGTSYLKATSADSFMGTAAAPSSITVSDSAIKWTLAGSSSSFTLSSNSKVLCGVSNNLYYRTGTATNWKASYTSSTKTFKIASGTRYLGLRDDLALSSTTKNPRFRCNASASTTSYQFYLYQKNG